MRGHCVHVWADWGNNVPPGPCVDFLIVPTFRTDAISSPQIGLDLG